MYCRFCNARIEPGVRHDCPRAPHLRAPSIVPPGQLRAWAVAGWILVALLAASLVVWLAQLAYLVRGRQLAGRMLGGYSSADADRLQAIVRSTDTLSQAVSLLAIVALAGYVGWFVATRKLVERAGRERRFVTGHWTYVAWRLCVLASLLLVVALRTQQSPVSGATQALQAIRDIDQRAMIYGCGRLVTLSVLITVLVVAMRRVRNLIADVDAARFAPAGGSAPAA
jgi:uncharacterized membrane protein